MAIVLIVDDDPEIRRLLVDYLGRNGYRAHAVADGSELRRALADTRFDLIVLDLMLPGEDGLEICRRLRSDSDIPIVMLTARGEETDRIIGLEMGADDYLTKPVDLRELDSRIKAVMRRATRRATPLPEAVGAECITFDGLEVDFHAATMKGRDGQPIALTAMEFRLLKTFIESRGRVLNRDQLLEMAHDRGWDPFDRSIDIRISRLRRKIERNPSKPARAGARISCATSSAARCSEATETRR